MEATLNLYDRDFFAWTKEQAKFIKAKSFDKLDIKHLFEEVESMCASEVRELENRLEVLLMHLLKWVYQPNLRSNSWKYTIKEQRKRIATRLRKMPSLKAQLDDIFIESYEIAIYEAVKETGLDEDTFPVKCIWTLKKVLDEDFLPE